MKKLISNCIIFERKKYIYRNSYLQGLLTVDKGKPFYKFQREKIWNSNGSQKQKVEISSRYNICHAYWFGWNTSWKKMRFQLALIKTFCPILPPLTQRRFKHHQRKKIDKTMLSASPASVFHTKFTTSVLKSK